LTRLDPLRRASKEHMQKNKPGIFPPAADQQQSPSLWGVNNQLHEQQIGTLGLAESVLASVTMECSVCSHCFTSTVTAHKQSAQFADCATTSCMMYFLQIN
jgi:hypothetical protein